MVFGVEAGVMMPASPPLLPTLPTLGPLPIPVPIPPTRLLLLPTALPMALPLPPLPKLEMLEVLLPNPCREGMWWTLGMLACWLRRKGEAAKVVMREWATASLARSPGSLEMLCRLVGDTERWNPEDGLVLETEPGTATAGTAGGTRIGPPAFFSVPWLDLAKVSAAVVGLSGSLESWEGGVLEPSGRSRTRSGVCLGVCFSFTTGRLIRLSDFCCISSDFSPAITSSRALSMSSDNSSAPLSDMVDMDMDEESIIEDGGEEVVRFSSWSS